MPVVGRPPSQRTQIVISDDVDDANGLATPIPYNTIRLWATPPSSFSELNGYRRWLSTLVFHEYVHILHIDLVGGLPAALNAVFGKLFVPNGLVPGWMTEGLAVTHEGDGDGSPGRNGNALFDMYVRALATGGEGLPPLDLVSNPMLEWPRGSAPYLLGGRFMAFVTERHGPEAMARFLASQGSMIWPWAPSWAGARAFGGETFPQLWDAFRAETAARSAAKLAEIRARPVTAPAPLTRRGAWIESPRWSPDGAWIAYHDRSLDEREGLRRVSARGQDLGRAAIVDMNGTFALRSPRWGVAALGEVWREHRIYDDLWLVDLKTGDRRRLTGGERATDPDVTPAGDAVVYVARTGGGELALRRRALTGEGGRARLGPAETLLARPGVQLFSPRVSPDGRRVALEVHEGGRRDIAILEDGKLVRVTDDAAVDLSPSWTPDGRWLLFASDRGGVYDVYAAEVSDGPLPHADPHGRSAGAREEDLPTATPISTETPTSTETPASTPAPTTPFTIRQVTNVETGALQPQVSPDGHTLAFVTYTRAGYDLATLPFDPASWLDPLPATPAAPPPVAGDPEPLPSHRYSALPTLGPTFWLPLAFGDGEGLAVGALTGGRDVLARHAWTLQAWWGIKSQEPGYALSYLGGWSWPRLDLSSFRSVQISPGPPDRLQSIWTPLDAGLSFTFTRLARALTLRVGWSGTIYDSLESYDLAAVRPDLRFEDGFLSSASLSLVYSDARAYARSISPEEGRSFTLGVSHASRETGSDFDLTRARAAVAGYLRVPGTRHAALAARLSGAIARGTVGGSAPFRLGGISEPDLLGLVLLGGGGGVADQLRGYPSGLLRGNALALANVELRFPIAAPELGRTTWPIFLRRLHGAVFLDAGDAFEVGDEPFRSHPFRWDRVRFGAGAELRLETFLGYWLRADVRLGVARGLGPLLAPWRGGPPSDPDAVTQAYVTIGSPF